MIPHLSMFLRRHFYTPTLDLPILDSPKFFERPYDEEILIQMDLKSSPGFFPGAPG